ncbi:hypothetical protein BB559_006121 [Furculomyces boomerangus]|uniref:Secreted protein n=2 Tax=Harpellales TaxID=61421 RepID=A0A2T9Y4P8_9FUNG|nr:hypothetical protein BB559_006401 [Furculomyces boomerangus]PVU87298.1 hypothetical protein BB559_006121 [Furculomyces boomerangus]PVZ96629.1 hypothetical protein BB558_007455 [Smittium angustum]
MVKSTALFLVSAALALPSVYGLTGKFFSDTYYKSPTKNISMTVDSCYTVGQFNSAIFDNAPSGTIFMYTGPNCLGASVSRCVASQYQPGNNVLDYNLKFQSVKIVKEIQSSYTQYLWTTQNYAAACVKPVPTNPCKVVPV